jgi:hypothetical protein
MSTSHTINGKKTSVNDTVQYHDSALTKHTATLKALNAVGSGHTATLNVAGGASSTPDLTDVPYSVSPAPHTWSHFPD